MWLRTLTVLVVTITALPVHAQTVKLPPEVKGQPGLILVEAETDCTEVLWVVPPNSGLQIIPSRLLKDTKTAACVALYPGRYPIQAIVAKGDKPAYAVTTVVVGDAPPIPPDPGPKPPDPKPPDPPSPSAPIQAEGFKVMMFYEEQKPIPAGQHSIIYGKTVREYLDKKCAPEGKLKGYWIVDQNTDLSGLAKHWQDAAKHPRTSVPWVIVSNGKTGYEGPMPATVAEMMTLLEKYGGK